ncbi:MAG: ABC transporter substrate-binding protein [Defluviitaleaceae bacterium]|nr:ABC transporter substrate-binding protein [Defluviitaleaceae bacterium]
MLSKLSKKLAVCAIGFTILLGACGSPDTANEVAPPPATNNETTAQPPAATGGPATTVNIWFMGGSVLDDSAVVEAANARLRELGLNIEVNLIWSGGWGMGDPAQMALDTGDTSVDIFWTGSWGLNFWNNARLGNFIRLDDLLARYGQDIYAAVPNVLWDAFTTDGPSGFGIYGIPGYKDYAQMYAWDVNNTRLAELGIDFDDLFDMNGVNYDVFFDPLFEEALAAAKDMWGPTFFPLYIEPELFMRAISNADLDLTGANVFHFGFDPQNPALPANPVVGLNLENDLYLQALDRLHHFWNQGFIDPRLAIPGESSTALVEARNAGEYLFSQIVYAYGHTVTASAQRDLDVRFPPLSRAIVSSVSAAGSGFGISVYSRNQAEAMQFMNAWYTDTELATILVYGVEGIHFQRNADGTVALDHDARASFSPWRFGQGNIFILPPQDVEGPDFFDRFRAYNQAGIGTSMLGFSFNNEPVSTELAALMSVVAEFNTTLTVGAVDPATTVPTYLSALRANGLDRVLDELNSQLQTFYAAR